jgi:hypothetical protein
MMRVGGLSAKIGDALMAYCMICNEEFRPARGSTGNFCAKHSVHTQAVSMPESGMSEVVGSDKVTAQKKDIVFNQGKYGCFICVLSFISIIIIIVFINSIFSDSGESKYPASVLDHKISVINGITELDVKMKIPGLDAGAMDMYSIANDMEKIAKYEINQSGSEQNIVFTIAGKVGGGYDDYGRPESTDIINGLDIQYSMVDLKKIEWGHITVYSFLNLGHLTIISPGGAKFVQRYCEKNRQYSQVFCDSADQTNY